MWYLLSAWDSQEWLWRWAAEEAVVEVGEVEEPVVEAEEAVEAARLVVEVEQPVVEARESAREFLGTRLRHLSMTHHAHR